MFNLFKKVVGIKPTKMVIVIRTDLNMGKGKIAAQAAHAAISLYNSAQKLDNSHLSLWLKYGQPKVVLRCDNIEYLRDVYEKAVANQLNACLIYDAGKTQVERGTLTTVGIGPHEAEEIDKITSQLKLL